MKNYFIYFRFRSQDIKGYVQDYGDSCLVTFTDEIILNNFTGQFRFTLPDKQCAPYIRKKEEAKDVTDLVRTIAAQLK